MERDYDTPVADELDLTPPSRKVSPRPCLNSVCRVGKDPDIDALCEIEELNIGAWDHHDFIDPGPVFFDRCLWNQEDMRRDDETRAKRIAEAWVTIRTRGAR